MFELERVSGGDNKSRVFSRVPLGIGACTPLEVWVCRLFAVNMSAAVDSFIEFERVITVVTRVGAFWLLVVLVLVVV